MGSVGLSGRSFLPLLSGYACAVPAIMEMCIRDSCTSVRYSQRIVAGIEKAREEMVSGLLL